MTIRNFDKSPVLLIVFNRIDKVKKVLPAIRKYAPTKLYVSADGPRKSKKNEIISTNIVRDFIKNEIDWECELITNFSNKNLGCKYGPLSAINWFFENEKYGIILEDDILPNQSFFNFCDFFLEKFQEDKRIYSITGYNINEKIIPRNKDYFFTGYSFTWGWATWKDRWEKYNEAIDNFKIDDFTPFEKNSHDWDQSSLIGLQKIVHNSIIDKLDAWDFPWVYTQIINNGLSVVPSKNLIKNIGFDAESTHTQKLPYYNKNIQSEINFPLDINTEVVRFEKYDLFITKNVFNWKSFSEKISSLNHYKDYLRSIKDSIFLNSQ